MQACKTLPGPWPAETHLAQAGLQQLQADGQSVTEESCYTAKQTINNTKAAKNFPIQALKGSAESSLGQSVAVKTTITETLSISTGESRA